MSDSEEPLEDAVEVDRVFERLPITLNVGFPEHLGGPGLDTSVIGWSYAFRRKDDGVTTIIMTLDPEASEMLKNLTEVFELRSMGFAAMKRRPQDGG